MNVLFSRTTLAIFAFVGISLLAGCAGMGPRQATGTLAGVGVGATAGALLNRSNPVTGAVVGGVLGGLVGNAASQSYSGHGRVGSAPVVQSQTVLRRTVTTTTTTTKPDGTVVVEKKVDQQPPVVVGGVPQQHMQSTQRYQPAQATYCTGAVANGWCVYDGTVQVVSGVPQYRWRLVHEQPRVGVTFVLGRNYRHDHHGHGHFLPRNHPNHPSMYAGRALQRY